MYWILLVMALIFSLVVATLVGGLATPRKHVAGRAITLRAAPERVWTLIRTVKEYPNWRDEVMSVEESAGNDPRPVWTEIGRQKSLSYVAVTDDPPRHFTARIMDDDLATAANGNTRLRRWPGERDSRLPSTAKPRISFFVFSAPTLSGTPVRLTHICATSRSNWVSCANRSP